jgi:hypothetical protein
MIRLGKKLREHNERANCFEFGIIAITEIGKERGNQFKTQELKETKVALQGTIKELEKAKIDCTIEKEELRKMAQGANQSTDKTNNFFKLIRHPSTIDGVCFARVFMDEQRPESLGADARDLCEVVHIVEKSKEHLAMPFYFIGELLHALITPKCARAYEEYRFNRGDNTLLMYLIKKVWAFFDHHRTGIYNRFGYRTMTLAVEDGASGQEIKKQKYYLMNKKIYSNRFATDAYSAYFAEMLKKCKVGINGCKTYGSHRATMKELESQKSYFITELKKYGGINEE